MKEKVFSEIAKWLEQETKNWNTWRASVSCSSCCWDGVLQRSVLLSDLFNIFIN